MTTFNPRQLALIQTGQGNTQRLKDIVEVSLGVKKTAVELKRHTYIYSLPGAGKTFTTAMTARNNGIDLLQIRGSTSIPAFVRQLAFAKVQAAGDQIIVWIDDCDILFVEEESLNVMKGALDEDINMLSWNKNLNGQIQRDLDSVDENARLIGAAMKSFQPAGSPGVQIPTDNVRFIITSNKDLCPPNKIYVSGKRPNRRNMHEGALRDRINYQEIALGHGDDWGWVASVLMRPDCNIGVALTDDEKEELLNFMYANWRRMGSTSMRAVKDLAAIMKNYPTNYAAQWQMALTK